jgi:hypothetical protein
MLSTMSSIANTYRALVTLCTNRQVTRLLKTVSFFTTHITCVERTLSPYQQDRFQTRPQVIGRSRLMSSETKACLHTTNPAQRGKSLPFLKTPSCDMTAVSEGPNRAKHDTVTLLTRCRHRDPRMKVRSQESPSQAGQKKTVEEKVSTISSLELLNTPNQPISPDSDGTLHIKLQALVRFILPNKDHSTTTSACMAVYNKFLTLGLSETTALNHDSEEFKRLHRYFHQSHPGRTEANDLSAADHTDIVIEDIFRICRTKELAGFCDVDLRNAEDSRRLLWHGSRTSNIAGILTQGLRIATARRLSDSFGRTGITPRRFRPRIAWYRDSRISSLHQEPCTFRLSLNSCSTFFNPPQRYYHRTAIPSTMHSTISSRANTYQALVTL